MIFISPLRIFQSIGFAAAAFTRTRTSPGPGRVGSKSSNRITSGPPYWWYWMRFIVVMVNTFTCRCRDVIAAGRAAPGSRPRSVGGFRCVRRRGRVDVDIEEPGERQGCQRLRDLLLIGGDDLDERCPPGGGNVVGADPSLRAQHLQLLLLVISERSEFREVRVVADCCDHHVCLGCDGIRGR